MAENKLDPGYRLKTPDPSVLNASDKAWLTELAQIMLSTIGHMLAPDRWDEMKTRVFEALIKLERE